MRNERDFSSAGAAGAGRRRALAAQGGRPFDARSRRIRRRYPSCGLQDVAFVRSPLAHARIRGISIPRAHHMDRVFMAADLAGVKPIRAVSGLPGFKISEQPVLAADKVRQVGELVAMCVARPARRPRISPRSSTLELEELPAIHDMLKARKRIPRWSTSTGATTFFSKPSGRYKYREGMRRADQGHPRDLAPRGSAWRRSRAAVC